MGFDKAARYWVAGIHISQMNNGGICMVTLADHEAALANERMPPDGYSLVETAAYNGLREAMIAVADENAALKKALAEKDKEIERLKHELDFFVKCTMPDLENRISELMAQAVRFAVRARDWGTSSVITEAQAFLNSDEAQAVKAQQKEDRPND